MRQTIGEYIEGAIYIGLVALFLYGALNALQHESKYGCEGWGHSIDCPHAK